MKTKSRDILTQNRIFAWIALATGLILLIPLLSMQFTSEVKWDEADFIVAGTLLFGVSSLFVLATRRISKRHRVIVGIAFALTLLYLWAELAVGIFTNWGS